MKADRFLGALLILATGVTFLHAAMSTIVSRPNGLGLFLAASTLGAGVFVLRSIWRDRL